MKTNNRNLRRLPPIAYTYLLLLVLLFHGSLSGQAAQKSDDSKQSGPDYSGMYSFLQEGEFLQLTIEDHGLVTGFVSRYTDSEHQGFSDHFFKHARLDRENLVFTTEMVQNVFYEFRGTVSRGGGRQLGDEGYYILKGTLKQTIVNPNKTTAVTSQAVVFRSFPDDEKTPNKN